MHDLRSAIASILLCLVFGASLPDKVSAQSSDIRPMLKILAPNQKQLVLKYLQHLGASLDDAIQYSFSNVPRESQAKTIQFVEALRKPKDQSDLTTVRWSHDTLFFSGVTQEKNYIDSFSVINTGRYPYLITGIQTTCDCTVVQAPDHPIMPGESAIVRFDLKTSDKLGETTPAIIIHDNSYPNKRQILYLNGDIRLAKKPRKYPWD